MRRAFVPRLALALVPFAAAPALADDIFVGSAFGTILRADVDEGVFQFGGVCGGPIRSMVLVEDIIMIGDMNGRVYGVNLDSGEVGYYYTIPGSNNSAMVAANDSLYVSTLTGAVRRVNPDTGQVLGTFRSPVEVRAMVTDGQYLYVAGSEGSVYRASITSGKFSYFACVCLGPINSLVIREGEILAGDERGVVMRFNQTTGEVLGAFSVEGDNSAMTVSPSGDLYVTNSTGEVRHVDPQFGDVFETFDANVPIKAIVFASEQTVDCAADFNLDGTVTSSDFFDFLNDFLTSSPRGDFNANGVINSADFFDFVNAFFTPCI